MQQAHLDTHLHCLGQQVGFCEVVVRLRPGEPRREEDITPPCGGIVSASQCLTPCRDDAVCHSQPTETASPKGLALIRYKTSAQRLATKGGKKHVRMQKHHQAVCTQQFLPKRNLSDDTEMNVGWCRQGHSSPQKTVLYMHMAGLRHPWRFLSFEDTKTFYVRNHHLACQGFRFGV